MIKLLNALILLSIITFTFSACEEKPKNIRTMDMTAGKYFHYKKADMDPRLKRYPVAVMMYEEAGSSPASAFDLGNFYTDKIIDYNEAIVWYTRAYEKDYIKAAHNIAMAYEEKKDYDNAIKWYEISLSTGLNYSYFNLALLYDNTIKNREKAIKYYKLDGELGGIKSLQNLTFLYRKENNHVMATAYYFVISAITDDKPKVLKYLRNKLKYSEETIKKGYELHQTMTGKMAKFKGGL